VDVRAHRLFSAAVAGLFATSSTLAKISAQGWTVGAPIHWDDTAKLFTTTSTSNTLAGVAVAVAANPTATGRVRLNGYFT
jgi:predicted RecA/RadA family phage recombinase